MSAFTRREFEERFAGRHEVGTRFTLTNREVARLKVTIEDGWEPDTCHLCGHKDAEHACDDCGKPVCLLCSVPYEDTTIRFCKSCAEVKS